MKQIVNIIKDIVAKTEGVVIGRLKDVSPDISVLHYEHGHYVEIGETLKQYDRARSFYNKKYPLVALFEDIREKTVRGITEARLTIVICHFTKAEYKSADRYKEVINPILEPIYKEFLNQAAIHPSLIGYDLPHDKIVRPFWGVKGEMGNRANIFSDALDAIEISNLLVKYKKTIC